MTLYEAISEIALPLRSDADVLKARRHGNELAESLRFTNRDRAMILIVISEIARNTVLYAKSGYMSLKVIRQGQRRGLLIVVQDQGPGITDHAGDAGRLFDIGGTRHWAAGCQASDG